MADIAMLVAEEYERRVKKSRKSGEEEIDLFSSCASAVAWMTKKIGDESGKLELSSAWKLLEPKTQVGLAAINGFFSA